MSSVAFSMMGRQKEYVLLCDWQWLTSKSELLLKHAVFSLQVLIHLGKTEAVECLVLDACPQSPTDRRGSPATTLQGRWPVYQWSSKPGKDFLLFLPMDPVVHSSACPKSSSSSSTKPQGGIQIPLLQVLPTLSELMMCLSVGPSHLFSLKLNGLN